MKLLIASDIHGSVKYTKKIIDVFDESFDYLILLGDHLYHGPRNDLPNEYYPKEVLELLNKHKDDIIAIKGNCDSEVDEMVLDFKLHKDYILEVNNKKIYLTHGHKYNIDNLPPISDIDYLFYGHFHTSFILEKDGLVILNPGSVSLPRDGKHSYAIMEGNDIKIMTID